MKRMLVALASALALAGCVSVESIHQQLNSGDPAQVQSAEENILCIATTGLDSRHIVAFTTEQQVQCVKMVLKQDLLLKIIAGADKREIVLAAVARIDFTKKGFAKFFVENMLDKLYALSESDAEEEDYDFDDDEVSNKRDVSGLKKIETVKAEIVSRLTQDEIIELLKSGKKLKSRESLLKRLIEITDSPSLLWDIYNGKDEFHVYSWNSGDYKNNAGKRLLTMLDKVADEKTAEEILDKYQYVESPQDRLTLLKKLPEAKIVKRALATVKDSDIYKWEKGNRELREAVGATAFVKDSKSVVKIAAAIMAKIGDCHREAARRWVGNDWGKTDDAEARKLLSSLPQLPDATIAALLCVDDYSWRYLMDKVSAKAAYGILATGKAKTEDFEIELVKKLPQNMIDAKIYGAAKFAASKKAIMEKASQDMKSELEEMAAKAVDNVMKKAKEAERETFSMQGFYLGMALDDVKIVLAHHFPDLEIVEEPDREDLTIKVSGQKSPFCYASAKDRITYQFNFGKKLLKKWYRYDAARPVDWARAFSKEHDIDMKLDYINRNDRVHVPNAMLQITSYYVSLHQTIWTYKNGMKNYRLTYFGESKISGDGPAVRELAREKYRYVSDAEGTLRAKIEED